MKHRYAKGEIDRETYLRMLSDLKMIAEKMIMAKTLFILNDPVRVPLSDQASCGGYVVVVEQAAEAFSPLHLAVVVSGADRA